MVPPACGCNELKPSEDSFMPRLRTLEPGVMGLMGRSCSPKPRLPEPSSSWGGIQE